MRIEALVLRRGFNFLSCTFTYILFIWVEIEMRRVVRILLSTISRKEVIFMTPITFVVPRTNVAKLEWSLFHLGVIPESWLKHVHRLS